MSKFLVISATIAIVFTVSCTSTKRQITSDRFSTDMRQKIENRDFTLNIKISDADSHSQVKYIRERNLRISGDSLISNMGDGYDYSGAAPLLPSKDYHHKFIYEICDYKVKNFRKNGVEVTFNHKLWSDEEMKFFTRYYRIIISNKGNVSMYLDNYMHPLFGKIE